MIDYLYLEEQIEFFFVVKRELHTRTRIELGGEGISMFVRID